MNCCVNCDCCSTIEFLILVYNLYFSHIIIIIIIIIISIRFPGGGGGQKYSDNWREALGGREEGQSVKVKLISSLMKFSLVIVELLTLSTHA